MVVIADKNGQTDSAYHSLVKHINSPIPIVMISWCENFVFNKELLKLKEYVLVCFCEYGWNYTITDSHIWGVNTENGYGDGRYMGAEWKLLDDWIKENPPKVMFKRELLKKDITDKIKPIEYPCIIEEWPTEHKGQFNERLVSVNQYWGRSNENRLRIHGEIWLHAYKKGFQVCDNIYYFNKYIQEERGEKWVTMWMPHWARVDVNQLMIINRYSKLSLSWEGAGFKCFRHMEAPVNSTMVMHRNDFSWSFDWNETNCVLVEHGKEIEGIEKALKNKNLHDIYVKGMENVNNYRLPNYIKHLEKTINEVV